MFTRCVSVCVSGFPNWGGFHFLLVLPDAESIGRWFAILLSLPVHCNGKAIRFDAEEYEAKG